MSTISVKTLSDLDGKGSVNVEHIKQTGTFAVGLTITNLNHEVFDGISYWKWNGLLPKIVPPGSTPTPASSTEWALTLDNSLRTDLAKTDSSISIAGLAAKDVAALNTNKLSTTALANSNSSVSIAGTSAKDIAAILPNLAKTDSTTSVAGVPASKIDKVVNGIKNLSAIEGFIQTVKGYYVDSSVGGGEFYYDGSVSKTLHNGGTIIAPEALAAWDGSSTNIAQILDWTGAGNGCFVRTKQKSLYPEHFGAKGDNTSYDDLQLSKHANFYIGAKICWRPSSNYKLKKQLLINANKNIYIEGNDSKYTVDETFQKSNVSGNWTPVINIICEEGVSVNVKNLNHYGYNDVLKWQTISTNFGLHAINIAAKDSTKKVKSVNVENIFTEHTAGNLVRVKDATKVCITKCKGMNVGFHGISTDNCDRVHINKNHIKGIGAAGGTVVEGVQGGIGILCSKGSYISITDNMIEEMTDTCSKTEGCSKVIYANNIGNNCGKDGFKVQGYPGETVQTEYAIFKGNQMFNLYDWRTDGSNLYAVHNTRRVIFTGNIGHSDPAVTGSGPKRGINLLNLTGAGSSGNISVTGNSIGKTFENDPTGDLYSASDAVSINIERSGTSGHTMLVSNNICWGGIHAGGGFGRTVISNNIVGIDSNNTTALILGKNRAGIRAMGSDVVVSGNTVGNFGKCIEVTQLNPMYGNNSVVVSNNIMRGGPTQTIDIAISTADANTREILVNISNNVGHELTCDGKAAIRLRPNKQKISGSIANNVFSGSFRSLLELYEWLEEDGYIGHMSVVGNSEQSTREDYFQTPMINYCERLIGDYATSSNSVPPTNRKYKRGDIIWNSAILKDRAIGWMMAIPETQTWVAMPNALIIP